MTQGISTETVNRPPSSQSAAITQQQTDTRNHNHCISQHQSLQPNMYQQIASVNSPVADPAAIFMNPHAAAHAATMAMAAAAQQVAQAQFQANGASNGSSNGNTNSNSNSNLTQQVNVNANSPSVNGPSAPNNYFQGNQQHSNGHLYNHGVPNVNNGALNVVSNSHSSQNGHSHQNVGLGQHMQDTSGGMNANNGNGNCNTATGPNANNKTNNQDPSCNNNGNLAQQQAQAPAYPSPGSSNALANPHNFALSAQAAAILAAGGFNPALFFNPASSVSTAAAAQTFLSFIQQQQQTQQPQQIANPPSPPTSNGNIQSQEQKNQPTNPQTQLMHHINVNASNAVPAPLGQTQPPALQPQQAYHNIANGPGNGHTPSGQQAQQQTQKNVNSGGVTDPNLHSHAVPPPPPPSTGTFNMSAYAAAAHAANVSSQGASVAAAQPRRPTINKSINKNNKVTSTSSRSAKSGSTATITSISSSLPHISQQAQDQGPPRVNSLTNNGLYAAAAAAASNPLLLAHMQNWKLDQLEAHVQLLRDANQPVPQPVSLLLAEARRREEKRTAKRVANRKSACTSRARKKALVEEMTRTNARLRRQALILALLPDLVIAIKVDGEITFCSAQVERVIRHKVDDLVGANIIDILIPSSKDALANLIQELVAAEQAAMDCNSNKDQGGDESGGSANSGGNGSAAVVSEQSDQCFPLSVVKVKSRQKCEATTGEDVSDSSGGPANNTSGVGGDNSTANSSFGIQSGIDAKPQSVESNLKDVNGTGLGIGNNSDASKESHSEKAVVSTVCNRTQRPPSSGDDSSSSSDAKNFRKASEALNRNVRWHNAKLMSQNGKDTMACNSHKDDVTGASVTANNADARLSSLQHKPKNETSRTIDIAGGVTKKILLNKTSTAGPTSPMAFENLEEQSSSSTDSLLAGVEDKRSKSSGVRTSTQNESASEDSGYRESGESVPSREDSASSGSDTFNGMRPRPLAPTCNVCLIRDDLTTIWCEVTSSIRTRSLSDEANDPVATAVGSIAQASLEKKSSTTKKDPSNNGSDDPSASSQVDEIKELLLCLRPIRDGVEKIGENHRFIPVSKRVKTEESNHEAIGDNLSNTLTTNGNNNSNSTNGLESGSGAASLLPNQAPKMEIPKNRPMKKRPLPTNSELGQIPNEALSMGETQRKKIATSLNHMDTEKSVAESLMLMSSHHK